MVRDGTTLRAPIALRRMPIRVVQEIRRGFPFVALHAGNLGFYGAWDTLLKAAKMLRNENTGLVFIGDGANRAALEVGGSATRRMYNSAPFRPVEQLPHVMMAGDVHIVTVKRGLEGIVVPSKLYSILAAGRPVLVVAPAQSDAARIVVESGCGWRPIPTIRRRSRRRSANCAATLRAWRKWAAARGKRLPNMLELMSWKGLLPS